MRFLQLVMYNASVDHERVMYEMTRTLNDTYSSFVCTIYYTFAEDVETVTYDPQTQILKVPGTGVMVPGNLVKTWAAFQWAMERVRANNLQFDYVVRPNISTVVNFHTLRDVLEKQPIDFAGGHTLTLNWLDAKSGIYNSGLLGTQFASGTMVFWSFPCFARLLEVGDQVLDFSIVDDVSLSLAMKRIDVIPHNFSKHFYFYNSDVYQFMVDMGWDPACLHPAKNVSDEIIEADLEKYGRTAFAFRHRIHLNNYRWYDLKFMARTIRFIMRWNRDASSLNALLCEKSL